MTLFLAAPALLLRISILNFCTVVRDIVGVNIYFKWGWNSTSIEREKLWYADYLPGDSVMIVVKELYLYSTDQADVKTKENCLGGRLAVTVLRTMPHSVFGYSNRSI